MSRQDRLDLRQGTVPRVLAGALIGAIGTGGVALAGLLAFDPHDISDRWQAVGLSLAISLPILILGLLVMLLRDGTVIDLRAGKVTQRRGLVALRRKVVPVAALDAVVITSRLEIDRGAGRPVYAVGLAGDSHLIKVRQSTQLPIIRRVAEEIADFLQLRLIDSTGGTVVERSVGRLSAPVRKRAQTANEQLPPPNEPPGRRIRYTIRKRDVTFDLPSLGYFPLPPRGIAVAILLIVAFAGVRTVSILGKGADLGEHDRGAKLMVVALISAIWLLLLLLFVWKAYRVMKATEQVTVSTDGLRVERHEAGRCRTWTLPATDLQEFFVGPVNRRAWILGWSLPNLPRQALIARAGNRWHSFGQSLTLEEQEWLRDAIRYVLGRGDLELWRA
jgi:hypothetical protein